MGYGVYALLVWAGLLATVATCISTPVGVLCSYLLNKFYTFQSKSRSPAELGRFVLVYAVSFVVNLAMVGWFVDTLHYNKYLFGVLTLFTTTLISYVGHRFFSFRNSGQKKEPTK